MAYTPRTQRNADSVPDFIETLSDPTQRQASHILLKLFNEATGYPAEMWGSSIIGFGAYQLEYASGQKLDWMRGGFSPRKGKFSIYIMNGFNKYEVLLNQLGKHSKGKSCLYISKLDGVDLNILQDLIKASYSHMKKLYPEDR